MTTRIAANLRRRVIERARNCCEYCGIHQEHAASTHPIDHVVAEKHGGSTTLGNLALSCLTCNLRKSSDVASFDPATGELQPLFNPRTQIWSEHFRLDEAEIVGLTPIGRTTVEFLRLNSFERLAERAALIQAGVYSPPNSESP